MKMRHTRSTGFSLMEMLIVLLIVGVLMATIAPRLSHRSTHSTPPIIQFLENERAATLSTGQPTEITLKGRSLISSATQAEFILGEGEEITVSYPPPSPFLQSHLLTTFYPDGIITATKFNLLSKQQIHVIQLSPFTRKIRYKAKS